MDWKEWLEADTQKKSEVKKAKRNKISNLFKLSQKSKNPKIIKLVQEIVNSRNAKIRNHYIGSLYYYSEVYKNPKRRIDIIRSYRKFVELSSDVEDFNFFLAFVEKKIEDEEDESVRKELGINWIELNNITPELTLSSALNAHDFLRKHGSSGVSEAISDFNRSEDFLIGIIEEIENREREREQCIKLEEQTSKSIAKEIEEFNSKFVYMELATKFRKYIEEFDDEFCTYEEISNYYESILFNYISVFKFLDNPNFLSLIIQLDSIGRQYFDTTIVSNFTEKALNQIDKKTKIKNALILFIKGLKESGLTYIHKTLCEILTDRDAVDILLKVLEDTDSKVREEIAKILEDIGDNKAIEPLFKILQEEKKFSTKMSIAKSLGKLGDERALEFTQNIEGKRTIADSTVEKTRNMSTLDLTIQTIAYIIVEETGQESMDTVSISRIKDLAKEQNIDEEFVDKVIEQLRSNGEIYSPRDGFVKLA